MNQKKMIAKFEFYLTRDEEFVFNLFREMDCSYRCLNFSYDVEEKYLDAFNEKEYRGNSSWSYMIGFLTPWREKALGLNREYYLTGKKFGLDGKIWDMVSWFLDYGLLDFEKTKMWKDLREKNLASWNLEHNIVASFYQGILGKLPYRQSDYGDPRMPWVCSFCFLLGREIGKRGEVCDSLSQSARKYREKK